MSEFEQLVQDIVNGNNMRAGSPSYSTLDMQIPEEAEWLREITGGKRSSIAPTAQGPPPAQSVEMKDMRGGSELVSTAEGSVIEDIEIPPFRDGFWSYTVTLVKHVVKPDASIRTTQARLTLWELLEAFDFINDFYFICRVGKSIRSLNSSIGSPDVHHLNIVAQVSILMLLTIWILSGIAYGVRRYTIYHRIEDQYAHMFTPVAVIKHIKTVGEESPATLYMFEKLAWTYQVCSRIFEDIPQLCVSAYFMAHNGQNFYTYFMVAYSVTLTIVTSLRMGINYPLIGTLTLVFSRRPDIDSPLLDEAAPTTRNFILFIAANFGLWLICNGLCFRIVKRGLSAAAFFIGAIFCFCAAAFALLYWRHLGRVVLDRTTTEQSLDESSTLLLSSSRSDPLSTPRLF